MLRSIYNRKGRQTRLRLLFNILIFRRKSIKTSWQAGRNVLLSLRKVIVILSSIEFRGRAGMKISIYEKHREEIIINYSSLNFKRKEKSCAQRSCAQEGAALFTYFKESGGFMLVCR